MNNLILDGHKINWHKDRVDAWNRGERIAPITIDCALTRRCTYNCVYCFSQLQANNEKKMTRDIILKFLDDAAEIGVKAISFISDGESTCSEHIYDAILRGKENGLDVALGTNGFLLDDNKLNDILPCLTYLRFNISAVDPVSYAKIMGCPQAAFYKVLNTIKKCVMIKKTNDLSVTLGLQMVLMPQFSNMIIPFANLGREIGVDYAIIKHCSDDAFQTLNINYSAYLPLKKILREAETYSTKNYQVKVKWSKLLSEGKRKYVQCYAPPFLLQLSGSGLVAPCGGLFHQRYSEYHIGNIAEKSFKEIWQSERYWKIMKFIASDAFDARKVCGTLCLQHLINESLWDLKKNNIALKEPTGRPPDHINFI